MRTDALASTLDLTPTLLDFLGLAPLPRSHGVSLKPVLLGAPNAKTHDHIFAEISHRGVLPNDGMQERSVYDLRSDPDEMNNLVAAPRHHAELGRLYVALRTWVRDTADASVSPTDAPIP